MSVYLEKLPADGPYALGKYDTLRDEYLHALGADYCDEHSGDVDCPVGTFALMINEPHHLADLVAGGELYGMTPVAGIIGNFVLRGDDRGFCWVETFETPEAARVWYAELDDAYAAWDVEENVTWTTEADYEDRESWEPVDSCWGFYGDQYARDEAMAAFTYQVERGQPNG